MTTNGTMASETATIVKAEEGNWDEDFKEEENTSEKSSQTEGRKTEYMDMSQPGQYKIRLVGPFIKCRKRFKPYRATVQVHDKDLDVAWSNGWPAPGKRFAVNVLDKTGLKEGEVGVLKVLEKGPSVFKHFSNYKAVFNENPSGKTGPDFLITVKIPNDDKGQPVKLKTEYSVMHLEKAPFTEAEVNMITKQKLWPLKEIYKSTSAESIQKMWDALSDDQRVAPKKKDFPAQGDSTQDAPTTPIEEAMDDAPANSDDLFNDAKGGDATDSGESGELF